MRLKASEASIQGAVLDTEWDNSLETGTSRCLGIGGQSEGGMGARSSSHRSEDGCEKPKH